MPQKKKTPSTTEAEKVSVPLSRSPFILPDEAPRVSKQRPSPAAYYLELAADVVSERRKATRRIKELEEELRADNAKAEKIKRRWKRMDLASVKDHKDLLAPSTLMSKQTELDRLRARSRDLPTQEAEYRARAERWRRLDSDPKEVVPELFSRLDFDDLEAFAMVCHLARTDPDAVQVLGWNALRFLTPLIGAAGQGNRIAAEELVRIAAVATRTITELGDKRPELFTAVATKALDWPVMVSRKENFYPKLEELLEKLQQGYAAPMPVIPESNWTRFDITGRVAWSLWHYVYHWREVARAVMTDDSWGLELDEFLRRAGRLDDFGAEGAWKDWWEVAKVALSEAYPKPEMNGTLRRIAAPKRERKRHPQHLWRSSLPQKLHGALRDKFRSFAGANRNR